MSAPIDLPSGCVTFLFTDIEASAKLVQVLGNRYRPMLSESRRLLRCIMSTWSGIEVSVSGDTCLFVFAEAAAALEAGGSAQSALSAPDWPAQLARPTIGMGVNTGFAEPHEGEYVSVEVFRAARVAAAARGGQVLCTEATAARVSPTQKARLRDLGLRELRHFTEPQRLFQLTASEDVPAVAVRPYEPADNALADQDAYSLLTRAQKTVALLVSQGLSNPHIAQQMSISRHTVETHMKHIFAKLGVRSRTQLAAMVARRSNVRES